MTDPSLPPAPVRSGIPGQRSPDDHPMRPDLGGPTWAPPRPEAQAPPDEPYAHWWRRVVATLIDSLLVIPFWVVGVIGTTMFIDGTTIYTDGTGGLRSIVDVDTTTSTWVGGGTAVAAYIGLIVFSIWNQLVRQGRRGASIGKACLYLMVVDEEAGRPIGTPRTFVRAIAHLLDGLVFYLGYLWPLFDRRRQTFADKLMQTVVLYLPPLQPRNAPQTPQQALPPSGW
jgi:uncharacterized RDD family membrane protein YckC